jgi:hypothetical protein
MAIIVCWDEDQFQRLLDFIDGEDYCPICDCHPSRGHDRTCNVGQYLDRKATQPGGEAG